jgi:hypothetical protein
MDITNITQDEFQCATVTCPAVYACDNIDKYIIVGKKVDPDQVDLADRIAEDETAVAVSKEMLQKSINSG